MFTNQPLSTLINPWTLRFRNRKLETYYRSSREEEYSKYFPQFYLIFASVVIIITTTFYLAYTYYDEGKYKAGQAMVIANCLVAGGIVFEFSISFWPKLRPIRTALLGLTIFIGAAIVNIELESSPVIRPGFCLVFSASKQQRKI